MLVKDLWFPIVMLGLSEDLPGFLLVLKHQSSGGKEH